MSTTGGRRSTVFAATKKPCPKIKVIKNNSETIAEVENLINKQLFYLSWLNMK